MHLPSAEERRSTGSRLAWLVALVALAALAAVVDLGSPGIGRGLAPFLGLAPEDGAGLLPRIAYGLAAAGALAGGVAIVRRCPFGVRVGVVWAVLLALFLLFFYNFDLKLSIIVEKFPFLAGFRLSPTGFLQGAALTLFVCVLAIGFSTLIGLAAALARLSKSAIAFGAATFYISFFRGTPLLVQVFLIYLGLPQIGVVVSAIPAGVIALSLNYGAYLAEIFRAGIQSIPHGQWEAATALGLKPRVIMWKVILPQAMRVIVPPTGSQFIAMLKDSALISMMGVWEIMFLARSYGRSEYRYIEMLLTAAAIYWVLSISFELVQNRLERYYGKGFRR